MGYAVTISGYAQDSRGTGVAGVTLTFSNGGGTVVTSRTGYYSQTVISGWVGTVTPSQTGYYFSPASKSYSRLLSDQTGQNYTRYVQTYTVSGYVRTSGGTGIAGVTMTFSNGGGTATTSSTGYYSKTVSYNYTGTVTPSLTGYTFSPTVISLANVLSDKTNQNFTGTLLTYYIYGYVRNAAGEGISGVNMSFSNGEGTVVTNSSGFYVNYVDYGWSGSVTPSIASHTFSPDSLTFSNVTTNYSSQNFTATIKTYLVSGYVRDSGGAGISGAGVTFSGLKSIITGSTGYYATYVDHGWSGSVTPVKAGYTFSPTARNYTSITSAYTSQNFTGTLLTYTISGNCATSRGAGIQNVSVSADNGGGSDVTDSFGNYSITVDYGWSGTVTPTATAYDFSPASRTYSSVTSNAIAQNYTGSLKTFTLAGYTKTARGAAISGVTVSFGSLGSVTSSSTGYYSQTAYYGWSGTAVPSKTGYTFTPSSRTYSSVTASTSADDFTGSLIQCLVSGYVTDTLTGDPIPGVTVTLSNLGGSDVTDSNGYWAEYVNYGWSGTVTPSIVSHTFTPASRSLASVTGSQPNQNFLASINTYKLVGEIQTFPPSTFGVTGVWVHFDGLDSVYTNIHIGDFWLANNHYSLYVPHGWSGYIHPKKTGYIFFPGSTYVADVTGPDTNDFVGEKIRYTISGTILDSNGVGIYGVTFTSPQDSLLWGVTNSDGEYGVSVEYGWSGTLIPSTGYCAATPESMVYGEVYADIEDQDYEGEYQWCTVTGKYATSLTRINYSGVSGIEIVVDAPSYLPGDTTVYTRLDKILPVNTGTYSVKVLKGAVNAFWPQKIGYRFTPGLYYASTDTTINVLATRLDQITVSGYCLAGTDPVAGAELDFYNNYPVYTDTNGHFEHDIYLNSPYDSVTYFAGPLSIRHDDYVFLPADTVIDSLFCDTLLGPYQARQKYQYPVIATAGSHGQISPAGTTYVKEMTDQWYQMTPDSGYLIDDVTIDGVSYGAITSYLFTNVVDSYDVHAAFAPESSAYTISVESYIVGNDSLIPDDSSVVPHGDILVNPGGQLVLTLLPKYWTYAPRVYVNGVKDTVNLVNASGNIGGPFEFTLSDIQADKIVWVMWMPPVPCSYYITSFATTGGTISPMGQIHSSPVGTYHYDIAAATGYYISDVIVDGVSVGDTTEYTFVNPSGSHGIVANFWRHSYNVTNTASAGGTVYPSGTFSVYHGDTVGVTIYPDLGYKIDSVWVDSIPQGVISSYVLEHITMDRSVDAWFSLDYHTITAMAGTGGQIIPSGDSSVTYFDTTDYAILPDDGYEISDVLVNDSSMGAVTSWSFTGVDEDQTISASFSLKSYYVIASAGTGGDISPAGTTIATHGDTLAFALTPATGYEVEDLLLDGVSLGKAAACTLAAIDSAHTLSAVFALEHLSLTATAGTGGSISPAGDSTVQYGDTVTYVITPGYGYEVDSVVVDGASQGAVDTFTFAWITEDHTINAYFKLTSYTITASAGANGSITPSGAVAVTHGDTAAFLAEPHTGYRVDSIAVDGVDAGTGPAYSFFGVTAGHNISVAFILKTYDVVASAGTGGSITPAGTTTVDHGEMLSYTITPDTGYVVSDVTVDGLSVGAVSSHTFAEVTSGHTVVATFAVRQFTLTAAAGMGGSVSPSGDVTVNYGAGQTFVMLPDTGYMVNEVLVDGISAGALDTFTFSNVTDDHSITASFTLLEYAVTATAGTGGSVSPSGTTWVDYGDSLQITVSPAAGHYIADVLVDGLSQGAVTSIILHDIAGNRTVTASFAAYTYPVIATAGSGGSVSPAGTTMVSYGDSLAVTVTPATGYGVSDVTVGGVSMGALGSYTFTNVTGPRSLTAAFALQTFTVTASAGTGGSVTPAGETVVDYGDSLELTVSPADGYDIAEVMVDGVTQGAVDTIRLAAITADHTVDASFSLKTYDIVVTAGSGGSVSPAGTTMVSYGDSLTVDIVPVTGYEVADVRIDGVSIGKTGSYTFTSVDQGHTLAASFILRTFTVTATAGTGGTVTPSGETEVSYGDSLDIVVSPLTGYGIADVLVDSVSQGAADTVALDGITEDHAVTASFILNTYDIISTADGGGSVSPAGTTAVDHGDSLAVAITPAAGYEVADVSVDGISLGAISSYTFTGVTAGHTLAASFVLRTFTVTATAGSGGSVSPAGATAVNYGDSLTVTVTAATGYSVADVLLDGVSQGAAGSVILGGITADHTVAASFTPNTYPMVTVAGAGGSVTPAGTTMVSYGDSLEVAVFPSTGYVISDVTVDGISLGAVSSYTFCNVSAGHTLTASYILQTFTVTATAGTGGSISPAGGTSVSYGDTLTLTVTAATGYGIADVTVDGVSQGAVGSVQLAGITADMTVSASFSLNTYPVTAAAGSGGAVSPAGTTMVDYGDDAVYTVTPDSGYAVQEVTVDGASQGAVTSYTFHDVDSAHSISASFALLTVFHTVVATADSGGSISPAGSTTVNQGNNITYTITPANVHWSISDVTVDAVSQGAVSSYTFTGITAPHAIHASFAASGVPWELPVYVSAGTGGSVAPSGTLTVAYGADTSVTIIPATGYAVDDVTVNGTSRGAVTAWTFSAVTDTQSLAASFVRLSYAVVTGAGAGGAVSPAGTSLVDYGDSLAVAVTPDSGYAVDKVYVDGVSVGAVAGHTFHNVNAGHTLTALFKKAAYTVTATAGTGGSISPSGVVGAEHGDSLTFSVVPDTGYVISDVLVDGVSAGTVASYTFNGISAAHTIAAVFTRQTCVVIASAGSGGSVSPAGSTAVSYGDSLVVSVTPDSGYTVDKVYADGVSVGAVYGYTFRDVTAGHTLTALFKKSDYMIVATAGNGGSITPSGSISVAHGDDQSFTVTPATGYLVDSVGVDGASVGAVSSYTFSGVTGNHTIDAAFTRRSYRIVASAGSGGSVSPAGTTAVLYGDTVTVAVTPDSGYVVDKVYVNGVSIGAVSSRTFAAVAADQSLSALFKKAQYDIIATAGSGGSIAPAGTVSVASGAAAAFTVTPAAGYAVSDVSVDGSSVGPVASYTFSGVSAGHTIHAAFSLKTYTVTATSGSGGRVAPAGTTQVVHGDSLTVAVLPDSGYDVEAVYVNGLNAGAVGSYTFAAVTGPQSLTAFFVKKTYTIVALAGYGGAVAPSGSVQVSFGDTVTFTISTMTGFEVNHLLVDGLMEPAALSYTFAGVAAGHTLAVECTEVFYAITATSDAGGSLVPGGDISAAHGSSVLISMVPDTGYHILDVTVDGASAGAVDYYLFSAVSGDHIISATWELNTYAVVVLAGAGGAAAPPGTTVCTHGDSMEIMIVPDPGYMISDVALDGNSLGAVDYYLLRDIDSSHTVYASFVPATGVYGIFLPDHGGALVNVADNPVTALPLMVKVYLPQADAVTLSIEKTDGVTAYTGPARMLDAGWHSFSWYRNMEPGLYIIRLEGRNFRAFKKVLIK